MEQPPQPFFTPGEWLRVLTAFLMFCGMVAVWIALGRVGIGATLVLAIAMGVATGLFWRAGGEAQPGFRSQAFWALIGFAVVGGGPGALILFLCTDGSNVMRSECAEQAGPRQMVVGAFAFAAFLLAMWIDQRGKSGKKKRK